MYESGNELLVKNDNATFTGVVLTVLENGSYKIERTGTTYETRPNGAKVATVDEIIRRYNLREGDSFPRGVSPVMQQPQNEDSN